MSGYARPTFNLSHAVTIGSVWSAERADEWAEHALCAQTDPEMFYPEKGGSSREAKRICSDCPVRVECLQEAIKTEDWFGIRAGFSGQARRDMVKVGLVDDVLASLQAGRDGDVDLLRDAA